MTELFLHIVNRSIAASWLVLVYGQDELYYVLQQKNGDLYLAHGYYDYSEKDDPGSDDTAIHRLYKLAIDVNQDLGVLAVSGGNAAPLTVFPAGTAAGNYERSVHWLTIEPGEGERLPFCIMMDGEVVSGNFLAFEPDTYETLEYHTYSASDNQAHLFENAQAGQEYIVAVSFSTEADADQYCFGVRFPGEPVYDLRPMVMVGGELFLDAGREVWGEIDPADILGSIRSTVSGSERPAGEGQSNFGCVGSHYAYFSVGLAVSIDQTWYYFERETELEPAVTRYYLTIGAEGVKSLSVTAARRFVGSVTADGSSYRPGETVYLEMLDGTANLRGVTVTSRDAVGNVIHELTFRDDGTQPLNVICDGGWLLAPEGMEWPSASAGTMVPTDTAMSGIFDRYLYLTLDGAKYRFERQDTSADGFTAGAYLDTVTEDTGFDLYSYTVYAVEGCLDGSMVLVHSDDMSMTWLYEFSPPKRVSDGVLEAAKETGCVVMQDGDVTAGQEIWLDFWEKTRQGTPADVSVVHYYTLDPADCSAEYYEAYKEDYPQLFTLALSYDGDQYTLRWEEYGAYYIRTYEHLICYAESNADRYVLTHDDTLSWEALMAGLYSSQAGDYIDFHLIYTDKH